MTYYEDWYDDWDVNEPGFYTKEALQYDFEKAYKLKELNDAVAAIEHERAIRRQEREFQLQRIAQEAKSKKVQLPSIFRFFVEYAISEAEKVRFWQYFYTLDNVQSL